MYNFLIYFISNRHTPLKNNWEKIYTPIVEHLKLQVRFNLKTRTVEIRVSGGLFIVTYVVILSFTPNEILFPPSM